MQGLNRTTLTALKFALLALMFFIIRSSDYYDSLRWVIAIPTLYAAMQVALVGKRAGWWIALGLLFSSGGDYAGAEIGFIPQAALFALAHMCYMIDFSRNIHFSRKRLIAIIGLISFAILYLLCLSNDISNSIERGVVLSYGVLIATMGSVAISTNRKRYGWYVVAALLFIISDSIIVWGRYFNPIPGGWIWVMTTYYTAQGIFMTLAVSRKNPFE